jgi:hypothetical protein
MSKIAMASISLSMAAILYSEMLQADAGARATKFSGWGNDGK